MSEDKIAKIREILNNYDETKEFVDYYQIFNVNPNSSIEEIKAELKKKNLRVLFHPDQLMFLPDELRPKFEKMVEIIKDFNNVLDDISNKNRYDRELSEFKAKEEFRKRQEEREKYEREQREAEEKRNQERKYQQNYSNNYNNNQNYNNNYHNRNTQNNQNAWNNQNNKQENKNEFSGMNFLQEALVTNIEKYGFKFAYDALCDYLVNGNINGFTRTDNARSKIQSINKHDLENYILSFSNQQEMNMEPSTLIMNFFSNFVVTNEQTRNQIYYLVNACTQTLIKYNEAHLTFALEQYSFYGNDKSFTNNNNARTFLRSSNFKKQDTKLIMSCLLNNERFNHPNFSYNYTRQRSDSDVFRMYSEVLSASIYGNGNNYSYQQDENNYHR